MTGKDKSNKLSVKRHLDELRGRLVRSVVVIVICTALAFVFHQQILGLLMQPAAGFPISPTERPIYTELTEFISIAFKVSLLAGLVIAVPYVLTKSSCLWPPASLHPSGDTCTYCCQYQLWLSLPVRSSDTKYCSLRRFTSYSPLGQTSQLP